MKKVFEDKFPLIRIDLSNKYQIRKTKRNVEVFEDLKSKIEKQGQIEALHIVLENGKYHIIAGFGRFEAMRKLGIEHCKAFVYEDINEIEIMKIAYGTNVSRNAISFWDSVSLIGDFVEKHPEISLTGNNGITSIFGVSNSQLLNYVSTFKFINKIPQLKELLSDIDIRVSTITTLKKEIANYTPDVDYDANKILKFVYNCEIGNMHPRLFEDSLNNYVYNHIREYKRKQGFIKLKDDADNLKGLKIDRNNKTDIRIVELKKAIEDIKIKLEKIFNDEDFIQKADTINLQLLANRLSSLQKKVISKISKVNYEREIRK